MAGIDPKKVATLFSPHNSLTVDDRPCGAAVDLSEIPELQDEFRSSSVTSDATLTQTPELYSSASRLRQEAKKKKEEIDLIFKSMRYAEKVDLCFMVDCTGSMGPWINSVKDNIAMWKDRLTANYKHLKLRVAFVRYTDFDQPAATRTTSLDFTSDLKTFDDFVKTIGANGGDDEAEDVFSGLFAVTKLSWLKVGTKVLVHMADAPCHGRQFYNYDCNDDYPDGDPEKRSLDAVMKKIVDREIYYTFGYIHKECTEKMVKEFEEAILKYAGAGNEDMCIRKFNVRDIRDVPEEVYRSVTDTISKTIERLSSTTAHHKSRRSYKIMESIPEWSEIESHEITATPELTQTTVGTSITLPSISKTIKRSTDPFAEGGLRLAYHAYDEQTKRHLVMKEYKWSDPRYNCQKRFLEAMAIQMEAMNHTNEFNRKKPPGVVELEFAPVGLIQFPPDIDGNIRWYTVEPYIEGEYRKFNSNNGYVSPNADPVNEACQAFSHFTWVNSKESTVVCDIQGVKSSSRVLLTDPAIHDMNVLAYGSTNFGAKGIKRFFQSHKCNWICKEMRIEAIKPQN